jgi:hypothetical protein
VSDSVYKVVAHDDKIYFCYEANKFDEIDTDEALKNYHRTVTEGGLLDHIIAFSILFSDIQRVEITTKRHSGVKNIKTNGKVYLLVNSVYQVYAIPDIIDYHVVEAFFKNNLQAPVVLEIEETMREKEAEKNLMEKYAKRSPEKLERFTMLCKILTWIGSAYLVWTFLALWFGSPGHILLFAIPGLFLPIAAFAVHLANKEIITLASYGRGGMLSVQLAIWFAIGGLTVPAFFYNIIEYNAYFWAIVIAATGILSALGFMLSGEQKKKPRLIYTFPLTMFLYLSGAAITTNVAMDFHETSVQFAENERKNWASGGHATPRRYYFNLNIYDDSGNLNTVRVYVDRNIYDRANIGDSVRLYIKPGLWGLPWVEQIHFDTLDIQETFGRVYDNVFINEYHGIRFDVPDDWEMYVEPKTVDEIDMAAFNPDTYVGITIRIERIITSDDNQLSFTAIKSRAGPNTTRIGNYDWYLYKHKSSVTDYYNCSFVSMQDGFVGRITIEYNEESQSLEEILAMFSGL